LVEDYETNKTVEIELDSKKYAGTFRAMSGTVIVSCKDEIKYAHYGLDRPEVVARWLLTDACP
jgi:hypothetical protein